MTMKRGRGGRPDKGPRDALMVRPPQALGDLVREQADMAGMTINDYVVTVLADAVGRPELAPDVSGDRNQEVLPLATSA